MRNALWLSLALLATSAPPVMAQRTLPVAVGSRIRIRLGSDTLWRVGRVVGVPPDTVKLQMCDRCRVDAYPVTNLSAVDVSQGIHSSGLKGAVVGGLTGIAVGVLVAYHAEHGCRGEFCGITYGVLPPLGGLTGFFVGGAIGSFNRREAWQPVAIPAWK